MTIDKNTARNYKRILRDAERLNALYNLHVLDTPYEADIDRLVSLACGILEAQFAYVALVDLDRIFIKSYFHDDDDVLVENDFQADEMSNAISQQVVIYRIPLVIDDVTIRDSSPTCIIGETFTSVIAVPLHLNNTHYLGALVICDNRVRKWSPQQLNHVTGIAQAIVDNFKLRREIIEHHRNEARLWSYSQELEVLNAELDAYGHTIAHDLKDPLNTVMGYASLVDFQNRKLQAQDEAIQHDISDYAHKIMHLCDSMTLMIDQLLSLAQIRDATIKAVPVDVSAIVRNVLIRFEHRLIIANAEVIIEGELHNVMGQQTWLSEIFANLIANALNYSDPAKVSIKVTISSQPVGDFVRYEVSDNGIGIDPEDVDKLFVKFSRLKNSRNISGTGIGLSIVANIVSRLGGDIGIESEIGVGSTFWFTLPAV